MQFQLIHPTWMQCVVLIFMGCSLLFQLMQLFDTPTAKAMGLQQPSV